MSAMGGGEILRAVLAANCLSSSPFFYCVELTGADGTATQMTTKTSMLQLKSQSHFLMTSLFGMTSNQALDQPEFINIFDASNQAPLFNGATVYSGVGGLPIAAPNSAYFGLLNDTLASCLTLPEYVLWEPNSLVGISWLGRNGIYVNFQAYRYLILAGIEYEMKGP